MLQLLNYFAFTNLFIVPASLVWQIKPRWKGILLGSLYFWMSITVSGAIGCTSWYDKIRRESGFLETQCDESFWPAFLTGWFYGGVYCLAFALGLALLNHIALVVDRWLKH